MDAAAAASNLGFAIAGIRRSNGNCIASSAGKNGAASLRDCRTGGAHGSGTLSAEASLYAIASSTGLRACSQSNADRLQAQLLDGGRSPKVVPTVEDLKDCDLYDVLAELGYRLNRRTRTQRVEAFAYKHNNFR